MIGRPLRLANQPWSGYKLTTLQMGRCPLLRMVVLGASVVFLISICSVSAHFARMNTFAQARQMFEQGPPTAPIRQQPIRQIGRIQQLPRAFSPQQAPSSPKQTVRQPIQRHTFKMDRASPPIPSQRPAPDDYNRPLPPIPSQRPVPDDYDYNRPLPSIPQEYREPPRLPPRDDVDEYVPETRSTFQYGPLASQPFSPPSIYINSQPESPPSHLAEGGENLTQAIQDTLSRRRLVLGDDEETRLRKQQKAEQRRQLEAQMQQQQQFADENARNLPFVSDYNGPQSGPPPPPPSRPPPPPTFTAFQKPAAVYRPFDVSSGRSNLRKMEQQRQQSPSPPALTIPTSEGRGLRFPSHLIRRAQASRQPTEATSGASEWDSQTSTEL